MALAQAKIYTEEDYYNIPENVHAELIDGQIYYQAAPSRLHQKISGQLYTNISQYIAKKNGTCEVYYAPFAVKLFKDKNNIVEPDISVICDPDKLTDQGCTGAPDWIIEIISPGNPEHDYIRKLNLYKDAGVREYWIVDPRSEKVFVYFFDQAEFSVDSYTFQDKIKVNIYDDFWIDFQELNFIVKR